METLHIDVKQLQRDISYNIQYIDKYNLVCMIKNDNINHIRYNNIIQLEFNLENRNELVQIYNYVQKCLKNNSN